MTSNAPSIFLSHSHKDRVFAERLAADLQREGAEVWIDEAEIKVGDSLIEKIAAAIDSVDYLAAVLSTSSVESEWVRRELEIAINEEIAGQTVKVLPLLLERCEIPKFLIGRLYADFTGPDSYINGLNLVLDRLGLLREPKHRRAKSEQGSQVDPSEILAARSQRRRDAEELASLWQKLAPGYVVNKNGLKGVRQLLSRFSSEDVMCAMEDAADSYLVFEDDTKVTAESWERAFGKIGAICKVRQESKENPEIRELYFIRGLLRRRLSYVDERLAINLLKDAHAAGFSVDDLREIAFSARNWSAYRDEMFRILKQ